jgi:hypothetical protein
MNLNDFIKILASLNEWTFGVMLLARGTSTGYCEYIVFGITLLFFSASLIWYPTRAFVVCQCCHYCTIMNVLQYLQCHADEVEHVIIQTRTNGAHFVCPSGGNHEVNVAHT